ncbi:hypothetical protein [Halobacterium zhouii]|uniref:hypothetical protein n=1 Tax=Halobacterium zhouii TaxID=2902624 RepID=UPI001E2DF043|nr:hypothetical protein [Halobacterium zhouii]
MSIAQFGVFPFAEEIVLLVFGAAAFVLARRQFDSPTDLLQHAAGAAAGSVFVAYGLREFLRATGGGYYCCNHLFYQVFGVVMTVLGWAILLVSVVGPVRRRFGGGGASADSNLTDG